MTEVLESQERRENSNRAVPLPAPQISAAPGLWRRLNRSGADRGPRELGAESDCEQLKGLWTAPGERGRLKGRT